MRPVSVLLFALLAVILAGCTFGSATGVATTIPGISPTLEFVQPTITQLASPTPLPTSTPVSSSTAPLSTQQAVLDQAALVITAIKDKDMSALASYVHPQKGLRFSPYAFVKDTDQTFQANKVAGLISDPTVYTWGSYSGTGASIDLTFADYYAKFIYDVDFANAPQVSLNHRLGVSTSMDNSLKFYSDAMVVEYHFPGFDPSLEGMDWRSLRLVFMQDQGSWYLVGVIHDQWTT